MSEVLKSPNYEANLCILDVGHGNASIIQENGTYVVIDTGARNQLSEYLFTKGITEVQLVLLSHSDYDHIGGLLGILTSGIIVHEVLVNADADKNSEAWRDLIKALDDYHYGGKLKFDVGIAHGNLSVAGFTNINLQVVAPTRTIVALGVGGKDPNGRTITSNTISSAIRVLYDGKPIALLTADMDDISLDEVGKRKIDISAQYLVYPHHGGLSGRTDPAVFASMLMHAVRPESVIFSLGRDKHSNPHPAIVQTILKTNAQVTVQCTQLSKHCADAPPSVDRSFDNDVFAAGQADNKCCAGSIIILFNGPPINHSQTAHFQFIDSHIPKPLCRLS